MIKSLLSKAAGGVSGFLASKGVTVFLLAVVAGVGGWIYYDIKDAGRVEAERDQLALVAQSNAQDAAYYRGQAERLTEINAQHRIDIESLQEQTRGIEQRTLEALEQASEAFRRCYDMPVPDGMRFGPSDENAGDGLPSRRTNGQAGANADSSAEG